MFTRIASSNPKQITINFEGEDYIVADGLSVAAALLEVGIRDFRQTSLNGASREPYCMMGICFDCLVIIDGQENQQSCMHKVHDGMNINRQSGSAEILKVTS